MLYVAVIGLLSNIVALFIKREKLKTDKFPFKLYKWEKGGRIYNKINIRKWKGKVPDMSKILKFMLPKKVVSGTSSRDIGRLIKETCVAELIHCVLIIMSLGVLFICPGKGGVFLFFVCLLVNLPFILIQRYNRPQYESVEKKLKAREEKLKQCEY